MSGAVLLQKKTKLAGLYLELKSIINSFQKCNYFRSIAASSNAWICRSQVITILDSWSPTPLLQFGRFYLPFTPDLVRVCPLDSESCALSMSEPWRC